VSANGVETAEDRAAMRAFLQRCEVRLSTMHRVATALLSGAGILVLLPALERDSVVATLRALLVGPVSWSRGLLAAAVALSIVLALTVVWLLVEELTRFYFHSNHIRRSAGVDSFAPRFTLTGLRMASDELSGAADEQYEASHRAPDNVELLVARNAGARARIDRRLAAYPGAVEPVGDPDLTRAESMFELAASRRRTLIDEVTKVEYGIVRHANRLQVIVLRYVKALLLIVVTALTSFVCAAAVDGGHASAADERWVAGALVVWSAAAIVAVAAPVRWLERLLHDEGAVRPTLGGDHELRRVERTTNVVAGGVWAAATVAMVSLLVDHDVTAQGRVASLVAIGASALVVGRELLALRRPGTGSPGVVIGGVA
jgi:hypothetical protein